MKKLLALVLVLVMAFTMVGCASKSTAGTIKTLKDLTDKKVGVAIGQTGAIYFKGDVEDGVYGDAVVEEYNDGIDAVQALLQDKIDAVIVDNEPAKVFVADNADALTILETAYTEEDYAIAVAKENTELTAKINEAIKALKEDGTLQAIKDYYIGKVDGSAPYTSPEGITYDGKLIMATNAEFPPYEFYGKDADGNSVVMGVDADFARAICDKMGKELVIEDMAFDSIIAAVQSGKADFAAAGMTVTEDRLKNIDFTDSYATGVQVVIVKK